MQELELDEILAPKLVQGENITQTYQFVATGNAELGFVALSQIYNDGQHTAGSYWIIPPALYPSRKQDVVLLSRGKGNPAAEALLAYSQREAAKGIFRSHGYNL